MPVPEVLQSLGDAIAGVDREAAYRKGMAERADINNTEAQTEAAIQLARDRRLEAQRKEREAAAREELRARQAELNDPSADLGFAIMEGGLGDEFQQMQQGRLRAQEFGMREEIATPSMGMGDDTLDEATVHEYQRVADLEALAPAAAITSRRVDPTVVPVIQPDGSTIWAQRGNAPGQRVGAPPQRSTATPNATGGLSTGVQNAIFRQVQTLMGATYDAVTGRFGGLDPQQGARAQRIASRAANIIIESNVDIATAVDQALAEAQSANEEQGGTIPPQFGDAVEAPAVTGGADVDPATGRPYEAVDAQGNKVQWINGQWVPVQP